MPGLVPLSMPSRLTSHAPIAQRHSLNHQLLSLIPNPITNLVSQRYPSSLLSLFAYTSVHCFLLRANRGGHLQWSQGYSPRRTLIVLCYVSLAFNVIINPTIASYYDDGGILCIHAQHVFRHVYDGNQLIEEISHIL